MTSAKAPSREHTPWSLLGLLEKAKMVSEDAGALAFVAHAFLHLHIAVWLAGLLSATIAALHLGGAFGFIDRGKTAPTAAAAPAPMRQGLVPIPLAATAPPVIPVAAVSSPSSAAPAAATAAMGAPAHGGILYGLDVSKWNGDWVDHLAGPLAGISFVFVRASDGLTADHAFGRHWHAVRKNGLVRGSYHFYRVDLDPEHQVQLYLRVLGGAPEQGDITPVLDFEAESFPRTAPPPKHKVQADLLRALQALERHGGRVPMIYTNWDTGTKWLDDERFARYPLWIADWSQRRAPRVPAIWAKQGFRFWQRTDHYQPPSGSRLAMDLDWFVGGREDLVR